MGLFYIMKYNIKIWKCINLEFQNLYFYKLKYRLISNNNWVTVSVIFLSI